MGLGLGEQTYSLNSYCKLSLLFGFLETGEVL